MAGCTTLKEVRFGACPALTDARGPWLYGCSSSPRVVVQNAEDFERIRPAVMVWITVTTVE